MAILPRYKRMKRRDWKDPFSWFNWYHQNKRDPVFLYRPESGRTGMIGFTNTRADSTTCAMQRGSDGIWSTVAANVLRDGHYHYDGTASYRTLLREGAGTNSALGACSFADGTYWAGDTGFTLATATTCISGTTAYRHTNLGATPRIRSQTIGVFVNAQTDCASIIVENVNAVESAIGIRDLTASAWVHYVKLTWATGAITTGAGSGTGGAIDLGTGPNGGKMYRVWMTATGTGAGTGAAGSSRAVWMYPTGTSTNTEVAIVHHAQFEAATSYPSSPIVTVAGAVTRAADTISVSWPYVPQAMTVYVDAYDLGASLVSIGHTWSITNTTGIAAPTVYVRTNGGAQTIGHNPDGTTVNAAATASVSAQSRMELRSVLASDGSVKQGQSINSAAETVSAASAARALGAAWAAPAKLYIAVPAGGFNTTNLAIRSIAIVLGNEQSMATMREIVRQ